MLKLLSFLFLIAILVVALPDFAQQAVLQQDHVVDSEADINQQLNDAIRLKQLLTKISQDSTNCPQKNTVMSAQDQKPMQAVANIPLYQKMRTYPPTNGKNCAAEQCNVFELWKQAVALQPKQCHAFLKNYYCKISPWKDLRTMQDRAKVFLGMGQDGGYSKLFGMQVETLACISAQETSYLEPMRLNDNVCDRQNKSPQQNMRNFKTDYYGMGQVQWGTLADALNRMTYTDRDGVTQPARTYLKKVFQLSFQDYGAEVPLAEDKKSHKPDPWSLYNNKQVEAMTNEIYNRMGYDPYLQEAVMALIFKMKVATAANPKERNLSKIDAQISAQPGTQAYADQLLNIKTAAFNYNAHPDNQIGYSEAVSACVDDMMHGTNLEDKAKALQATENGASTKELQKYCAGYWK